MGYERAAQIHDRVGKILGNGSIGAVVLQRLISGREIAVKNYLDAWSKADNESVYLFCSDKHPKDIIGDPKAIMKENYVSHSYVALVKFITLTLKNI